MIFFEIISVMDTGVTSKLPKKYNGHFIHGKNLKEEFLNDI